MYKVLRWLIGLAMGFYFRRIDRFHAERVPASGPILFTSNHPNSLTDSFVIGASVPRKVSFVATVQLFRFAPLKWALLRCGVIPINRVKDNPRAMKTVTDAFEACFRVLETGEAVGIFPEGITYDDANLKEIKSGAARMALELEHRHQGKLGLKVAPVGLTYSAKEIYRSDVLVHFGEPINAADFLAGYQERRKDCINRLTDEIERRIASLIVHLPRLEHERVVAGVKRLYFDRFRVGHLPGESSLPRSEELVLTQRIIKAVEDIYATDPQRADAFAARLDTYERWLARFRFSDEDLAAFKSKRQFLLRSLAGAVFAVLGAPISLYGWVHRLIPYFVVRFAANKLAEPGKKKAQTSTASILSGLIAFALCYAVFILIFHSIFGWPASLWYALSLPAASLLAHYYLRESRRWLRSLRHLFVLLRASGVRRRLLKLRQELIAEIEAAHAQKSLALPS
jgi:1-acyl-sn-glycerol-3-phosphate acyltransferase